MENGFNVPLFKSYNNIEDVIKDINLLKFPVIVKPTDSSGSKGVTKVVDDLKLIEAIECALSNSKSHEFIIEEFLETNGYSSDCDGFVVDGKLEFISFSSQRFDKSNFNPYVPAAYSWPETINSKNKAELKSEIQRLLKLLKMKTSIYNIETKECKNGKNYIMELSPRGGGNRLAEIMEKIADVDLIMNSVKAALGLPVVLNEGKNNTGYWVELILHSQKSGIFDKLIISEKIKKFIIEEDLWVENGTEVKEFFGANCAIRNFSITI